ncbi:hypothetical protein SBADM41S_11318 [Streptomyces badius]
MKDGLSVLGRPWCTPSTSSEAATTPDRGAELSIATWPVTLTDGEIVLRPIKMRDQRVWREVNRRNRDWLRPWEATVPPPAPGGPIAQRPT